MNNKLIVATLFVAMAMFASCAKSAVNPDTELRSVLAQDPVISTGYTNEEIAALLLNFKSTHHQNVRTVDAVLLEKFKVDFPNAYDIEWETNGEIYEVEFEIGHRDFDAYYDKDGNLLLYRVEIREGELPAAVREVVVAKYPAYRFDDVEKIVSGTETFYKMEMKLGGTEVVVFTTDEGTVINKNGTVIPDVDLPPSGEVPAEMNPAVSTNYTNEEIAAFIQNYRNTRERDVKNVDAALLEKFQLDFAGAYDIEWETNDELYEVEFEINRRDFEAFYDIAGNLLSWKQELRATELPATVKDAVVTKYPTYRFDDIEKAVRGTETFYKIEMEAGKQEMILFVSEAGEIISEKIDY